MKITQSIIMMKKASNERVRGPLTVNISDGGLEGSRRWVQKPLYWLTIIHQVAVVFIDNLWDRGVCWGKLGIVSTSGKQGARNLMDIV